MTRPTVMLMTAILCAGCAASYPGRIADIESGDTLNQISADSAPQQSVVNGWTARDYLKLLAEQNTEHAFLMYAVIALLSLLVLMLSRNRPRKAVSSQTGESSLIDGQAAKTTPENQGLVPRG